MTTQTRTFVENVTLTIPAGYVEDARSALVREIRDDTAALASTHEDVLAAATADRKAGAEQDREAPVSWLQVNLRLLDGLLAATGDASVTGTAHELEDVLQAFVRVVRDRLATETDFAPIPMERVLELSDRLQWAAERSLALEAGGVAG